jgi:hypothetical protein
VGVQVQRVERLQVEEELVGGEGLSGWGGHFRDPRADVKVSVSNKKDSL